MTADDALLVGLRDELVSEGLARLAGEPAFVRFTGDQEADALLNDLRGHPHAFLFGCLADRWGKASVAWRLPQRLRSRLGGFEFDRLSRLTEADWLRLMREPRPAHRTPETMARVLHRATTRVAEEYDGDAAAIWCGKPSSARLVRRLLEFDGAGPKIATMTANILVRNFKVPLADHRNIDISADRHVCRVMGRLGFTRPDPAPVVAVYSAREQHPDYPGVFDLALFDIGQTVCRPTAPRCGDCRLERWCAQQGLEA